MDFNLPLVLLLVLIITALTYCQCYSGEYVCKLLGIRVVTERK